MTGRYSTRLQTPATSLPVIAMVIGLAALYLPIYGQLLDSHWQRDEYSFAPLIALASAYLLWRERQRFATLPAPGALIWLSGWSSLLLGLFTAWLGHAQDIAELAMLSQLLVLSGLLLILYGTAGWRIAAFPVLFLLFMVPLPGIVLNALTLGLKEGVSALAVHTLQWFGYPAARSGVIILIGPYQMLVADACSGMHSLISLSALGLLFIKLRPPGNILRRFVMLAAIVPIALAANLLRTLAILLMTYHAGDITTRAWHEFTGFALFILALGLLIGLDHLLARRPVVSS